MLLSSCNLPEDKVQLVMSGMSEDLTYKEMKATILHMFGHGLELGASSDGSVFSSGILYTSGARNSGKGKISGGRPWSRWGSRLTLDRSERDSNSTPYRRRNPKGKDGLITACHVCRSIYHWAKDCPHSDAGDRGSAGDGLDGGHKIHFSI